MRALYIVSILSTAALLLAGCGGVGTTATRGAIGDGISNKETIAGFSISVSTDKSTYAVGEPISITVKATNTDVVTHTLNYPSNTDVLKWGYVVARDGKLVTWEYWSGHQLAFPMVVGTDTYAPGDSRVFNYVFPFATGSGPTDPVTQLKPGTYQIYAKMPTECWEGTTKLDFADITPASDPATITVLP